jgi:MraZ protein
VFFGQFHHRLNSKKQVTIPARFRGLVPLKKDSADEKGDKAREELYLVRTGSDCLYLYTQREIEGVIGRLRSTSDAADPDFRRMLTSRVSPVDMDAQGRIVIPAALKEAVAIDVDVVFVGNAERIEIWPRERWLAFEREREPDYERKLGERLDELFEA